MSLSVGEALVRLLADYGVDTVFGIPGVHTLELYRGLGGASGVRHVQARHEMGAGFMADGYARATGKPGVAFTISGPGVTNAATALGQAHADSVPLLLISAEAHSRTLGKGWGVLHEVSDLNAVTRPLCALSERAMASSDIPAFLARAFALFAGQRPRPCHLSIPLDVLSATVSEEEWAGHWQIVELAGRPAPDAGQIALAASLFAAAQRPLILVGGGARGADVTGLAERLGAPVIASNAGKGVVPDSHGLSLGGAISRAPAQEMIGDADLVIAIGTELAETDAWVERLAISGKLIRIDIDPAQMQGRYAVDVAITGDAAQAVSMLSAALDEAGTARREAWPAGGLERARMQALEGLDGSQQRHVRLLRLLRETLPQGGVVFGDACQLTYTASFAWPVEAPGLWHYAAGYCALGFAFPMAVGAKLALPDRPVVAFAGDGGMQFSLQELVTAAEEGAGVALILWHNDGYKQIRDDMRDANVARIAVDGWAPDYMALARAMHCHSVEPASAEAFGTAVRQALAGDRPTLILVREEAPWLA